jgi:hypothetical protein
MNHAIIPEGLAAGASLGDRVKEKTREGVRSYFIEGLASIPKYKDKYPAAVPALRALESRVAGLDLDQTFETLLPEGARGGRKYLFLPKHVLKNYARVRHVGLLEGPPRRILDLGAGSGVFCFVAQAHGHYAVALERPSAPTRVNYAGLHKLYGVPVSEQKIRPMQPLLKDEALADRFDLINATAICFNVANGQLWDAEAYMFFLRDLRDNFLAPDGRIVLRFNGMLYGGKQRSNHNGDGADYYRALGQLLAPFAIDPQPGSTVVLDPFQAELATDVVLPEVDWTEIVNDDESDEDEDELDLDLSSVPVLPIFLRGSGRVSRLTDLAAMPAPVPVRPRVSPIATGMYSRPPKAAVEDGSWTTRCVAWLKNLLRLVSNWLGFEPVVEKPPALPQSPVERMTADILAHADAGDVGALSGLEPLGEEEMTRVVAAIAANPDTLETVVSAYIAGLEHVNPRVRLVCAQALERYGHPRATEPLVVLSYDDVARVRLAAARALGPGAARAKRPIARYAMERVAQMAEHDPVVQVRRQATIAVGQLAGPRAATVLERLVRKDRDEGVRRNAARMLRQLSEPSELAS